MKTKLLILFLLCFSFHTYAQQCHSLMEPVSLQDRINEANLVIEGKVIQSTSQWNSQQQHIFTIHEIAVYKGFKGSASGTVNVITQGGHVGDILQTVSFAPELHVNDEGIFILKPSSNTNIPSGNTYQLVAASQGFVKYDKFSNRAHDIFNSYRDIENDVYPPIQQITGSNFTELQARPISNVSEAGRMNGPVLYSFSPLTATAGTQTVLTITGNNFGATQGTVGFSNADDGGATFTPALDSQVLSWSNTDITVQIPGDAGTGVITIITDGGATHVTTVPLTIQYAQSSPNDGTTAYPASIQDLDGNGGITFAYHTGFNGTSAATYFEQAFEAWNCESNVNFTFSGTTTTNAIGFDNENIVQFDSGNLLPSGAIGAVTTTYSTCPTTGRAFPVDMDITWDNTANFYYGSGTPGSTQYDFKTVALHELGHALRLGHVIDDSLIMHYSISQGENRYALDQKDIDGANYVINEALTTVGCGIDPMTEQYNCCEDIVITTQPVAIGVEETENASFTVAGTDYDTIIWQLSTDNGTTWNDLSNDTTYSGVTGTTLSINNAIASLNGNLYRAFLNNLCDTGFTTDEVNLYVTDYTLIPDDNFVARLEALGYDDITGDGKVPTDLISGLSSLTISSRGISDLTGIEDFVALQQLYANNNAITTVDFSNNTALTRLELRNNNLSGALDVTANTNMDRLQIQDNELTSLNITGLTRLQRLYAAINNFTEIDLSSNTRLKEVGLNDNNLSSLNLKNGNNGNIVAINLVDNSNLTCVLVDDVQYSIDEWSGGIDAQTSFSEYCTYTQIEDIDFEDRLEALGYDDISSDGQVPTELIEVVTTLDVSSQGISNMTGIEDFVALQTLIANDNQFSSITISDLTQLTQLNLEGTALSSIDVSNNTSLTTLNLKETQLTTIDVSANDLLEDVNLENIGTLTAITFGDNMALRVLNASFNAIETLDLTALTALEEVLVTNNELTSLDVRNGNNTSITSFNATSNADLSCIQVDNFTFAQANFTKDATANFSESDTCLYAYIPDANFETALFNLGYDDIAGDNQVPLALITGVTELIVQSQGITDLTGIEFFSSLTSLSIGGNTITDLDLTSNITLESISAPFAGINTVDLTGLTNLTGFNLNINNLTTLDLTTNSALINISLKTNDLEFVDLRNGANNLIDSADFRTNPDLTCIFIEDASIIDPFNIFYDSQTNFTTTDYCDYTAIPDENFEARLNQLGYDDISGDFQVPTALIENVTSLNLNDQSIEEFTGLGDFISLVTLRAEDNLMTTLNISTLVNLEILDLDRCKLSGLDVSNNLQLKELYLDDADVLSNLDLTTNTLLEYLGAYSAGLETISFGNLTSLTNVVLYDNDLQSLDLSTLTTLAEVSVSSNDLTYLNVQNGSNQLIYDFEATDNPNLTCILVDNAVNSNAAWTDIDAQTSFSDTYCRYTTIPDANFEAALEALGYDDISGDGQVPTALIEVVTALDLTGLAISDITGIKEFTSLLSLDISRTDIAEVDISNMTSLETFFANPASFGMTSFDASNATGLKSITIEDQNISPTIDIDGATGLEELILGNIVINEIDVSTNTALETLSVYGTLIESLDVSNLTALKELQVYDTFTLSSLDLTNNSALVVLNASNINSLTSLDIRNGNNDAITSFNAIDNPNLTCILVDNAAESTDDWTNIDAQTSFSDTGYCRYTAIPDANFEAALEALGYDDISGDFQVPTALIEVVTTINLSNNGISNLTGIEDFAALEDLTTGSDLVATIDLSSNTLLKSLEINSSPLTSLNLSGNSLLEELIIEDTGATIANLNLENNTLLKTIDIDNAGLQSIELPELPDLEIFFVTNNNLTASIDLSASSLLERIALQGNNILDLNIKNGNNDNILSVVLTDNPNLTCVLVDNATESTMDWTSIDAQTSFSDTYCRYTAIPDANFEAALEALGYDDISGDYQVPTALIETVTSLSVDSQSILYLTGIEDFTALTVLSAGVNDLTSIDVSDLLNLEELYLSVNQITAVDLSNLTQLKKFWANVNALVSLDLSNNTLLEELNVENNSTLTTLDVSQNSLLDFLDFSNCAVSSVDLSQMTQLTSFDASDNQITSIDFSNNPLVYEAYLSNNPVVSLDMSNQSALEFFDAFGAQLTHLNIQNGNNNNLDYFDITGNPNLTCVLVDNVNEAQTNLTDVDAQVSFSDTYCRYTTILDANFEERLGLLGYDDIAGDGQVPTALIETVTSLNVSYPDSNGQEINDITGIEDFVALEHFEAIAHSISDVDVTNNTELISIDINTNGVNTLNVTGLTKLETIIANSGTLSTLDLSTNSSLITLNVSDNAITSLDVSMSPQLTSLACNVNSLTQLNIKNGSNETITEFDATNNPNLTCILVDNALNSTTDWNNIDAQTSFSETYCRYTSIPDDNFEFILSFLGYDDVIFDNRVPTALIENLTSLDLSGNAPLSILELTGIEDFINLEHLDVSGHSLTTLDLSTNTKLLTIDCRSNSITSLNIEGLTALMELNASQNQLTSLDVSDFTNMILLNVNTNNLISLNVANGNNDNFNFFNALFNANLTCIKVDSVSYSNAAWTLIDSQTSFTDAYCRYTTIDDAAFETALETLGYDDISGDGQVPTALIENISDLSVSDQDISDLTGIQDFVSLRFLSASGNNLSTVDLSGLAVLLDVNFKNNNLIDIDFGTSTSLFNINIEGNTTISSIDVSNNTGLEFLRLGGCTALETITFDANTGLLEITAEDSGLTSLDTGTLSALNLLDLDNTQITSLDLSANTNLSTLRITNTPIENLNLKNGNNDNISTIYLTENPNLTCVLVDNAADSTDNWTNIDAQTSFSDTYCRYTTISDAAFETELDALGYDDISGDNQVPTALIENVTSLTLFGGITDITGIEGFAALEELILNEQGIVAIDLTSNTQLRILSAFNALIETIDISNNSLIESLDIPGIGLTSLLLPSDLSNLKTIDLTLNSIETLDFSTAIALEEVVLNELTLVSLNMQNGNNDNITLFDVRNNPNLTCVLVDNATDSTNDWTNVDAQTSFNETSCTNDFSLALKVFLQGAALNPNTGEDNLMRDDLRVAGLVPTTSPYDDGLTCDATVFDTTGDDAIVDWVWVELRDATDNTLVSYSRSALLQRDGDVVDVDGTSVLSFSTINDTYYMGINHRNHLGMMSAVAFTFTPNSSIDFTTTSTIATGGDLALTQLDNGSYALYAGDVNNDNSILNTDISEAINLSGSINSYSPVDADLDGNVLNTDINLLIQPNAGRIQQFN